LFVHISRVIWSDNVDRRRQLNGHIEPDCMEAVMHTRKHLIISMLLSALLIAFSEPAIAQNTAPSPRVGGLVGAPPESPQQSTTSQRSNNESGTPMAMSTTGVLLATAPAVVLVPADAAPDNRLNNGCWVRLHDKDAMQRGSDNLTIVGRMHLPTFQTPSGVNWSGKTDSLTVGPNAKVTVFGERDYGGKMAALEPGRRIRDLNSELGFGKSIDSVRVDCLA
jgi:hypothetical protein